MENLTLNPVLFFIIGGLLVLLIAVLSSRRRIKKELKSALKNLVTAQGQLQLAYQDGIKQGRLLETKNPTRLTLEYRPYMMTVVDKGFFSTTTKIQIGYQCQPLVNDIPCLEPQTVIERQYEEREVDKQMIEKYLGVAMEITYTVANARGQSGQIDTRIKEPLLISS